ncbi:MAG: hypothetical protein V7L11_07960 [Nostoc sp.]|uniref:hypothetical protein n=1 Tax=Nostoc sp. TaxID=1180 RepID=UPI002FF7227F
MKITSWALGIGHWALGKTVPSLISGSGALSYYPALSKEARFPTQHSLFSIFEGHWALKRGRGENSSPLLLAPCSLLPAPLLLPQSPIPNPQSPVQSCFVLTRL